MAGRRAAILVALAAGMAALAEPYAWPLDTPRRITSSFGEYRSFRHHAGIDLRAAVGTPVFAADDGEVTRVRVSPWGYGKAVYLRVADGNTIIYGHLDGFNGAIEAFVRRAQHARQSYSVDLYPEAGQLTIARGELLAYSGATGAGPPHLHYEIRDRNNFVINPRLLGIAWPDDTRPVVSGVAIIPKGPQSRVNGDVVPLIIEPRHAGGGLYTCASITVSGPIGIAVAKHDPANDGANRLGIHTLEVLRDGEPVFQMVNDRLDYSTMHHGAVAWHPYLLASGRYLNAFRYPGNRAEPYRAWAGDGFFTAPPAGAEIEVILRDFLGNQARIRIPLEAALDTPPLPAGPIDLTPRAAITVHADWLTAALRFDEPLPHAPLVRVTRAGRPTGDALPTVQSGQASYRVAVAGADLAAGTHELALVRSDGSSAPFASFTVIPRGAAAQTVKVGDATLTAGPEAPFGTMLLDTSQAPGPIGEAPIAARGLAYPLGDANTPIDAAVTVRLPLPADVQDPRRAHIYRRAGSSWSHEATERKGNYLELSTRRLGTFAVLEDDAPPAISDIEPGADAALTTRRPILRARVSDRGSGIADVRATLDGRWLLFAYDPDAGAVAWKRDHDLPSGQHTLSITVTDRAGNATTATRLVTLP